MHLMTDLPEAAAVQVIQCSLHEVATYVQVSKAANKKVKRQQKAVQLAAKEEASAAASSPVGTSSAPATTSGAELQVCPLTNLALIISCASANHCSACVDCPKLSLC